MTETITLWRPTGSAELELVRRSGWTSWPPRLPDQPIFYPVTDQGYAEQIARDWNTKTDDKVGYVVRFRVRRSFLDRYNRKVVGNRSHQEYWMPAADLDEFNRNIVGLIEVVATFTERDRLEHEARTRG